MPTRVKAKGAMKLWAAPLRCAKKRREFQIAGRNGTGTTPLHPNLKPCAGTKGVGEGVFALDRICALRVFILRRLGNLENGIAGLAEAKIDGEGYQHITNIL